MIIYSLSSSSRLMPSTSFTEPLHHLALDSSHIGKRMRRAVGPCAEVLRVPLVASNHWVGPRLVTCVLRENTRMSPKPLPASDAPRQRKHAALIRVIIFLYI